MKNLSIFALFIFAIVSCNSPKNVIEQTNNNNSSSLKSYILPKLEYVASTRGFYERITIENQTVWVTNERDDKTNGDSIKISDDVNKELHSYLNDVNLEQLATYKDPTQKRFYDGAAIAYLKITVDGKEYKTTEFDHGIPPVEIEKLVNKITSFETKK